MVSGNRVRPPKKKFAGRQLICGVALNMAGHATRSPHFENSIALFVFFNRISQNPASSNPIPAPLAQ